MDRPERIICILGMHRSGTSCLTGSLEEAGLHLGDIHTWNPFNLKGNRENQAIVDLNDAILADNGGSWDHPPEKVVWSQQHKQRARELLAQYKDVAVMGFKDPRTMLVLEGWKEITGGMEYVGIFRHPNAVARSLERRSQLKRRDAMALWHCYNNILYQQYSEQPFPVLCFDDPEDVFQVKLAELIPQLGLRAASQEQAFYDSELKLFDNSAGPWLPWKVRGLYKRLRAVSI
jgi:hypothetical protein